VSDAADLVIARDPDEAARRAASEIAGAGRVAVLERGRFTLALSGGSSPLPMFERLGDEDVPWDRTAIWQVDERVAPDGDPDRNLRGMLEHLPTVARAAIRPMPVTERDVEEAAERYASELPDAFDAIQLGLGADGHTASLVPGDPVLEVDDRDVALTGVYQGRRRMTLTYRVLERSRLLVWFVLGGDKADALARLLAGDATIPAGRVRSSRQLVVADPAAAVRAR
jgi:6-phosphogluconolactonase